MIIPVRIGVPTIQLSVEDPTVVLPSCLAVVPGVCAEAMDDMLINDLRTPMDLNTNYQFMVALVGHSPARKGGYEVTPASQGSGIVQLTLATQAVRINIPSATMSALTYADRAVCAIVFSKKGGSSLWKVHDFAYIEPGADFNFVTASDPMPAADAFDIATLRSLTADDVLGPSRAPIGVKDKTVRLTQGGVTVGREVSTVNVDSDQAPAFGIATSRAANITFASLANGIKEVIEASGGEFYKVTLPNASVLEIAQKTIMTAFAVMRGNRRIKLQMPNEAGKAGELRVYIGNLFISQSAITENWQKAATTPIQFVLSTAPQDSLLTNQFVELIYRRS